MFVYTVKDITGLVMLGILLVCGLVIAAQQLIAEAKHRWAKWRNKRGEN